MTLDLAKENKLIFENNNLLFQHEKLCLNEIN